MKKLIKKITMMFQIKVLLAMVFSLQLAANSFANGAESISQFQFPAGTQTGDFSHERDTLWYGPSFTEPHIYKYLSSKFTVSETGTYQIGTSDAGPVFDTVIFLVEGKFDPTKTKTEDVLMIVDDAYYTTTPRYPGDISYNPQDLKNQLNRTFICGNENSSYCAGMQLELASGKEYSLVVTNYQSLTKLNPSPVNSANLWLYCIGPGSCNFVLLSQGPSAAATRLSMFSNAVALRKIFGLQTASVNPGLSYDCSLFDTRGICVSFGGKRTNTSGEGADATAGVLIAGYRLNPNVRFGAFIDQRTGTTTAPGLRLKNSNPELGLYVVWTEKNINEGLYARAALKFGKNDITITRPDVVDSEPGEGAAKFKNQAAQITVGRGYRIAPNWVAAPHVGLRYVNVERGSYSEALVAGVVDNPLSYSRLKQESYAAVLGVAFTGDIAKKTKATFAVGVDHDFRNRISDYSATGVNDLTAVQLDEEGLRKTRPVMSAEFAYSVDKTSQISAKITYRKEAFKSIETTTGFVSYTKGF